MAGGPALAPALAVPSRVPGPGSGSLLPARGPVSCKARDAPEATCGLLLETARSAQGPTSKVLCCCWIIPAAPSCCATAPAAGAGPAGSGVQLQAGAGLGEAARVLGVGRGVEEDEERCAARTTARAAAVSAAPARSLLPVLDCRHCSSALAPPQAGEGIGMGTGRRPTGALERRPLPPELAQALPDRPCIHALLTAVPRPLLLASSVPCGRCPPHPPPHPSSPVLLPTPCMSAGGCGGAL